MEVKFTSLITRAQVTYLFASAIIETEMCMIYSVYPIESTRGASRNLEILIALINQTARLFY